VKTTFRGIHNWPEAPEKVAFLRNLHRHIFYVSLMVPVTSDDREVEFFILQEELVRYINAKYPNVEDENQEISIIKFLGHRSCEMIASEICSLFINKFHSVGVEVSEDNENSAIVHLGR
jgi:hypothetical protein